LGAQKVQQGMEQARRGNRPAWLARGAVRLSGAEARRRVLELAAKGGDARAALELLDDRVRRENEHRLRMLQLLELDAGP
jgi:hypothetical protein